MTKPRHSTQTRFAPDNRPARLFYGKYADHFAQSTVEGRWPRWVRLLIDARIKLRSA